MVPGEVASMGRHRHLADSEDSDDEADTQMVLTTAKASDLCPKPFRLIARSAGFTALEDMSTLSALDYVDLTGNELKSVQGLSSNWRLKTLILRGNKLSDVEPVLKVSALRVLDIADNEFVTTEWLPRALFAADLVALVARGNRLATLDGLACLRNLETLVLSDNQIEDLSPVSQLASLTKLSASNNCVRIIPDTFMNLHKLCELRLAHNRVSILPSKEKMARLSSLKILDLGHNRISSFESLGACSDTLVQVNLRNNPASSSKEKFPEYIRTICLKLEVIDGQRVAGGRRKLRVNRQRLQAGFPLEPDRKYARPPSAYYLKSLQDSEETARENVASNPTPSNPNPANDRAEERKGRPRSDFDRPEERPERAKSTPHTPAADEERDVLDADKFVEMAKSKSLLQSKRQTKSAPTEGSRSRETNKRKRVKLSSKEGSPVDEFGAGGASKW